MFKALWRWLKREPKTVYVPVFGDGVPHIKKWNDTEYLRSVANIGNNNVWTTEVIEVVSEIRNLADNATTPEQLKGYTDSIKVVKRLLTLPELAKSSIERLNYNDSGADEFSLK